VMIASANVKERYNSSGRDKETVKCKCEYERIIMETSDSFKWPLGDTVTDREAFVPKIH
jgi:hypothetical protein